MLCPKFECHMINGARPPLLQHLVVQLTGCHRVTRALCFVKYQRGQLKKQGVLSGVDTARRSSPVQLLWRHAGCAEDTESRVDQEDCDHLAIARAVLVHQLKSLNAVLQDIWGRRRVPQGLRGRYMSHDFRLGRRELPMTLHPLHTVHCPYTAAFFMSSFHHLTASSANSLSARNRAPTALMPVANSKVYLCASGVPHLDVKEGVWFPLPDSAGIPNCGWQAGRAYVTFPKSVEPPAFSQLSSAIQVGRFQSAETAAANSS